MKTAFMRVALSRNQVNEVDLIQAYVARNEQQPQKFYQVEQALESALSDPARRLRVASAKQAQPPDEIARLP